MKKRPQRPVYSAALLETPDRQLLIVRRPGDNDEKRVWQFPRGPAGERESPEAAVRRVAAEQLDVKVEIMVGQPPFVVELDGVPVELRYFFCVITDGTPQRGPYAEIRWVPRVQIAEYEFDAGSQPVADWLTN
jgi:ADP-ribose pyrophosphatase YjhB (NUDIX family)